MDDARFAAIEPAWLRYRDDLSQARARTDDAGRRIYHLAATLWTVKVQEVYAGVPHTIEWSEAGCTVDGRLFTYAS